MDHDREHVRRAGRILASRMEELGLTPATLADKAGLDVTTVRAAIRGDRRPSLTTRQALANVIGWPVGHIDRIVLGGGDLTQCSSADLLTEFCRRVADGKIVPVDAPNGKIAPVA